MESRAGYATSEYLLVLQPEEALHEKVMLEKNNFAEKYNAAASTFGKPNIVLLRFTQQQMVEERIIRQLRGIAGRSAPLKVELRDFGSEPTHSIFLQVAGKWQIQSVVRQLRQLQRLLKFENTKPHFITEPRMVIARKLTAQQYEQAWKEYQQQSFSGRFMAGELVLLKRAAGLRSFQFVERFALMNKQEMAAQGSLFF